MTLFLYLLKLPVVEEQDVVGFDEVAETLIKRLNGDDHDLDIITIIGMPGLGKTTLARKIYNDPTIEYEFFRRAWVYVSKKYSKKEVYLSILSCFMQERDYTNMSDEFITAQLYKLLSEGKYLIVIDDLWTTDAWNDLKNVFPNKKKGSRILITSRNGYVAKYANPNPNGIHYLKFLTQEESWGLLEIKVFGKGKCPTSELHTLGEHIAAKCEGLPLAIVVIAGILLNNRALIDWWQQVAENVNTYIVTDEKQFMEVIAMSYNHLPYRLKSCFLYLGVFPEDYEIPVWKLICLWMAEGFIEQDGERSLEDIAEACVEDLVNRNLLMVVKRKISGQVKTCRLINVLFNFCQKEASSLNFYHEIKGSYELTPKNYRRVCVNSNVWDYISSKPVAEHVRTFLCFSHEEISLPKMVYPIFKAFKLIRVLDMKSIILNAFPKDLFQLVLLRYLALYCNVRILPRPISQLWNMQTLIFITTSPKLDIREEMWKMYQLRHLHTNASAILACPDSQPRSLEFFQSLSMISPESCVEQILSRTPNITKLGIRGNVAVLFDDLFENVGRLIYLTNLKLYNVRALHDNKILTLPPSYKFPSKLKKLLLSNTLLDWEHMKILENLENLEVLKLKDNAFKGETWEPKDGGFRSLKLLHIERTDLVSWKASKHHFSSLIHLVLRDCDQLVEVPRGFVEISSFQVLELYNTNRAAVSARRIQHHKLLKAVKETSTSGEFKLTIYPPDM